MSYTRQPLPQRRNQLFDGRNPYQPGEVKWVQSLNRWVACAAYRVDYLVDINR